MEPSNFATCWQPTAIAIIGASAAFIVALSVGMHRAVLHSRAKRTIANIEDLPNKLLVCVAEYVANDDVKSRCAFARTSRRFRCAVNTVFDRRPAFLDACRRGCVGVVQGMLADPGAWLRPIGFLAFTAAIETERTDVVRVLLADSRIDPSGSNNAAIRDVSAKGATDIVRLLLDHHCVDPTVDNNEAIMRAGKNGHTGVVRLLLRDGRVHGQAGSFAKRVLEASIKNSHWGVAALLEEHLPPQLRGDHQLVWRWKSQLLDRHVDLLHSTLKVYGRDARRVFGERSERMMALNVVIAVLNDKITSTNPNLSIGAMARAFVDNCECQNEQAICDLVAEKGFSDSENFTADERRALKAAFAASS